MNRGKIFILCLALASFVVLTGCNSSKPKSIGDIPEAENGMGIGSLDGTGIDQNAINDGSVNDKWSEPGQGPEAKGAGGWADNQDIPGVSFPTIYFAYDQDTLGSSEQAKLDQIAQYLQDNAGVGVVIEGHCDERGSVEYNRALGERRAITVQTYLVNLGIPDTRFKTQSFGEERPAVQGSNEEAWSKNRRAELHAKKMN